MHTKPPTELPFALSLHQVRAAAGEAGIIVFWIENRGFATITACNVTLGSGPFADAPSAATANQVQLSHGESMACPVAFRAGSEGVHAFHVQVQVTMGWQTIEATVNSPILVTVQSRQRGGDVVLELPKGALVGDIRTGGGNFESSGEEGSITNIETGGGSVRIRLDKGGFVENISTAAAAPESTAGLLNKPAPDKLVPLRLVAWPPEWARKEVPSLLGFANGWLQLRRQSPLEFCFIDDREQPRKTARLDDSYMLRLRSRRGGHVTLLTQGSLGHVYQLLPHGHFGLQTAEPGQPLYLPSRPTGTDHIDESSAMLFDSGLAASGQRKDRVGYWSFALHDPGVELALVIVSSEPLIEPMNIFDRWGERANVAHPDRLRQAMNRAWANPDCEVTLASLNVQAP